MAPQLDLATRGKKEESSDNSMAIDKKRSIDTPRTCEHNTEAYRHWLTRRLNKLAADVFTATTIRKDALALKRYPPEIRLMIYNELLCQNIPLTRVKAEREGSMLTLKYFNADTGKLLKGIHYLKPEYVGDQLAAEVYQVFYEKRRFSVGLEHLFTLLQECGFSVKENTRPVIRDIVIYYDADRRFYTGSGKNYAQINVVDWIDPAEIGITRQLDQRHEIKRGYWGKEERFYRQAERAGLRALCQLAGLKDVEFRVIFSSAFFSSGSTPLQFETITPAVRHLMNRGVTVKVICASDAAYHRDEIGFYEPPDTILWYDITEMFRPPSSEDRKHVGSERVGSGHSMLAMHLSEFFYTWADPEPPDQRVDWRPLQVRVDNFYMDLVARAQSDDDRLKQVHTVEDMLDRHGPGLMHYGSLPAAEAYIRGHREEVEAPGYSADDEEDDDENSDEDEDSDDGEDADDGNDADDSEDSDEDEDADDGEDADGGEGADDGEDAE